MRVDLQGEGIYTYECDDPKCWFCRIKANGFLEILEPVEKAEHKPNINAWNIADIEFLKRNFNTMSLARLSKHLNRKRGIISLKARTIGLENKVHVFDHILSEKVIDDNFNGWF